MTTTFRSLIPAVLGVAALAGATAATSSAAEFSSAQVVRPLAGISFDVGSKHAVGYYQAQDGTCNLTLLVGDAAGDTSGKDAGTVPARFSSVIPAGRSARIDTGEGPSVEFVCAKGAETLLTRVVERLAYSAPAK